MYNTFEGLGIKPSLIAALEKENITVPMDIQIKVIPEAMRNIDLIVQSETGTGKTLAYLLPLFGKLDPEAHEMQAIILAPTHELAIQILRQTEFLSQNSDIKLSSAPIIGNVNIERQIQKLKERPHILVGSPGRILELIKRKKISAHTVKTIIIDEADRLLDDSNQDNVKAIIKSTLKERQLMMFSATISTKAEIRGKEIMKEPLFIKSEEGISIPDTIEHTYFYAERRDKPEVMRKLARIYEPLKAIVFADNNEEIDIITDKLRYHGLKAEKLHSGVTKLDRKRTLEEFRDGKVQLLIASDVAARGLDIQGVTQIFNMNLPEDCKDYLHRAGRTGRNGNPGTVISIVTDSELALIAKYEKNLKIKISEKTMYKGQIINKR